MVERQKQCLSEQTNKTKSKLSPISVNTLQLDDITVQLSDSVKTSAFSLTAHCSCKTSSIKTSKSCYYKLRRISSAGSIFPSMLQGRWSPHSFCPSLINAILSFLIFLLPPSIAFRAFRTVARFVLKKQQRKTDHITTLFPAFHWLLMQR